MIIAVVNQKGGVGKTTVTINLGAGLARENKKVLLIDYDPQGSLTDCSGILEVLGKQDPDEVEDTIADVMMNIINDRPMEHGYGIVTHPEGMDVLPANIGLAGIEVALVNVMCRELVLKNYIETIKNDYDYILIDCAPSLGLLTVNALAVSDKVIIPVLAEKPAVMGLQQLIKTIGKVRRQMNPEIQIGGILPNMVDTRTNYEKGIVNRLREVYGSSIRVFENIPQKVKMAETSAEGKSIFAYAPKDPVAQAYEKFVKEVLRSDEQ